MPGSRLRSPEQLPDPKVDDGYSPGRVARCSCGRSVSKQKGTGPEDITSAPVSCICGYCPAIWWTY